MPVIASQGNSKVKLVLNAGLDENNKTIRKSKTFSNVKAAVENEDLYNVGVAISGLQEYQLTNIVRYDEYELLNEI
ncbi:MAG TPA: DUF1659 domain-containing protein [Tissierellia bacterium]|jgi:hypothetical protein|nr:DUF1659 domain-containing protein [Sedimentibacter sp.]HHZ00888.1 DUF1659 domain-containing protein [Tissierellia bacterium]